MHDGRRRRNGDRRNAGNGSFRPGRSLRSIPPQRGSADQPVFRGPDDQFVILEGALGLFITKALRRATAPAGIVVAAGLMLAPAAQAAAVSPARTTAPALHTSGKAVRLERATSLNIIAEAPNGTGYFAVGRTVFAVKGTSRPSFAVRLGGTVLAVAATDNDVFAQTGLKVFEYSVRHTHLVRQWKLSSPVTPLTSAGLLVVGRTVWSWTDWATDESGLEYATVSDFSTSSAKVRQVSKADVYPGDVAADSAGLYYEVVTPSQNVYLALSSPSGATKRRTIGVIGAPVALSSGRVDLLGVHGNGHLYVDSFRASTLAPLGSKRVSDTANNIAGTTAGLLILECGGTDICSKASVGVLNPATGSVSASVSVPHAYRLLAGPAPAVLTDIGGNAYLVRLAR